jgi:tight adherence protein B
MNSAQLNLWTALAFFGSLLVGFVVIYVKDRQRDTPASRVRQHLNSVMGLAPEEAVQVESEPDSQLFDKYQGSDPFSAWLAARRYRLQTVSGGKLQKIVLVVLLLAVVIGAVLLWLLPLGSWWGLPTLLLLDPVILLWLSYRWVIGHFKKRFLAQFPDALDLIIRAVRAGVPANQAMGAAGREFADPLGHEFSLMGDALRLGIDLPEVLADAEKRIEVPDFSFFCVCLLLQRETGGQLTETLENLALIIRARREMGQKARALTGEARGASKMIAAIPVVVVGLLFMVNKPYIMPMFVTDTGLFLLKIVVVLVVSGLLIINHMSNLKV